MIKKKESVMKSILKVPATLSNVISNLPLPKHNTSYSFNLSYTSLIENIATPSYLLNFYYMVDSNNSSYKLEVDNKVRSMFIETEFFIRFGERFLKHIDKTPFYDILINALAFLFKLSEYSKDKSKEKELIKQMNKLLSSNFIKELGLKLLNISIIENIKYPKDLNKDVEKYLKKGKFLPLPIKVEAYVSTATALRNFELKLKKDDSVKK